MQQFDPNFAPYIEGGVTALTVTETPYLGLPNHVVNAAEDFKVAVEWEVNGALADFYLNNAELVADWRIEVYAESLAGSTAGERRIGTASLPKLPGNVTDDLDLKQYKVEMTVPAGTLREAAPVEPAEPQQSPWWPSGMYKLIATVFLNHEGPGPFDIIGFFEGPVIQVERPE